MNTTTSKPFRTIRLAVAVALFIGTTAFWSVGDAAPAHAVAIDCSRGANLSFEDPVIASNWAIVAAPGWVTTDTGMEIWQDGFLGVIAPDGGQISELQGNNSDPRWQDLPTLEGDSIDWSVYHRGRSGSDRMLVEIGSTASQTVEGDLTTSSAAFVQYSGTYVVPTGQTTTRFALNPQDTDSTGNLVDAIALELECEISVSASFNGWTDSDGSGDATAGDGYALEYLVTNEGSATLTSISVVESLGDTVVCPVATLMPGESTTCTTTHTTSQTEVDAGVISSSATAEGTDAAGLTASDSSTATETLVHAASLGLTKAGVVDPTPAAPAGRVDAGDSIVFSFDLTNTGNVTLSSLSVVDADIGSITCPAGDLAPGATVSCSTGTYSITQNDVDAGEVVNSADASAQTPTGADVADDDTVTVPLNQDPNLSLTKTTVSAPFDAIGQVIVYDILATNSGNVTLTNVTVTDPTADVGSLSCDLGQPAVLAPAESLTCTADVTVVQEDLDIGFISNTASGTSLDPSGSGVVDDSAEVTVTADQQPAWNITKTSDSTAMGDGTFTVAYDITVENHGNVTLTDVRIFDDLDATFGPHLYSVVSAESTDLAVNPTFDGSVDTAVTGPDLLAPGSTGTVALTIIAGPLGDAGPYTNEATLQVAEGGSGVVDTAQVATTLDVGFDLGLSVSAPTAVGQGEEVTWSVEVDNAGPSFAPGPLTMTNVLPLGVSFVSAGGTGWTCAYSSGTLTCTHPGNLNAAELATIAVITSATADVGSTIANTFAISADDASNETDPANNVAIASVRVDALPVTGMDTAAIGLIGLSQLLLGLVLLRLSRRTRRLTARP